MAKGLLGGMTDYNHQSMTDILNDLEAEQNRTISFKEGIEKNIQTLIDNAYWTTEVPFDFKNIISYSVRHFQTAISEFDDIRKDLLIEVKEHHIKRLNKISLVAQEINVDIGKIWHQEYHNKEYSQQNFRIVEDIYADTRDMAVNLLDTANIAERLQDYIGKQNKPLEKKKFKLEFGHKIALGSLAVGLLVFLFGNNIIGRYNNNEIKTNIDTNNISVINTERIIDTLNLPYLTTVPILDKGLFLKYYYNDLVFGGVNIDTLRINARTKTGEYLKMNYSNNEITLDINAEPYIEIEYKQKFYSFETTGKHYTFNCIIKELKKPTLQLKKP
jgi:hypothetical protein